MTSSAGSSYDLSVLQDLLDLDELGEDVVWPRGLTALEARRLLKSSDKENDKKMQQMHASSSAFEISTPPCVKNVAAANTEDGAACQDVFLEAFRCPITQQLMTEPVITPSGHSYEASAIYRVAKESAFSPQTKRNLQPDQLVPNRALADAIQEMKASRAKQSGALRAASAAAQPHAAQAAGMSSKASTSELPAPSTPPRKRTRLLAPQVSAPKEPPPVPPRLSRMPAGI